MRRRFDRQGLLALQPTAFMGLFVESGPPERPVMVYGDIAVVDITGPLAAHSGGWEDSYEAIVDRVTVALATAEARAVVLRIDSPGGVMHGAFDAARTLRERAQAAGKPLVSYITGDGCSAAYALAAAGQSIQVSASACVGSIGILVARLDQSAADASMGIAYTLFQSGQRKPYGNPHVRVSPGEMATAQAQVDALAEVFFDTVNALRPALSADALRALEAGIYVGTEAVALGLADGVAADLQAAVAAAVGGGQMPGDTEEQATAQVQPSSSQQDVDEAREALQRAANDGNERAREALAVLEGESDGPDDEEDEDDDESASASAAAPAAAASTTAAPAAAQAAPGTVSAEAAASFASENEELRARLQRLEAQAESQQMTAMLARRKDLTKELRAKLRTMPLAEARALLACMPEQPRRNPAAGAVVRGSAPAPDGARAQAEGQPVGTDPRMQRAFAMNGSTPLVERTPLQTTFRAPQQHRRFSTYTAPQQPATQTATPAAETTGTGGDR